MNEPLDATKIVNNLENKVYFSEKQREFISNFVNHIVDDYNNLLLNSSQNIAELKAENYAYKMIIAKSNFKPFLEEERVEHE